MPDERAELIRRFGGRHEPIPALVHAARGDAVRRNDILDLAAPLSTLVHGRVALAGDAAHAMTPDLGQGGNQALEDAVTLAALVAREPGIDAALARYDTTRRARTAKIARRSRQIGRVAQARGRLTVVARDTVLRLTPATRVARAADRLQAWRPPS
ncbi:FAD-dependent monooxygenase [Pseudonocardia dioxanivorans]|uniref:FAD-dependent monooxygenase n=1 Tax=Pseudonocardia dioxanivorans TaxID=240495 RepID=UPI00131A5638|nr:FAD-dependent monooxygenase [Pseudonocardia dioxanivorans]